MYRSRGDSENNNDVTYGVARGFVLHLMLFFYFAEIFLKDTDSVILVLYIIVEIWQHVTHQNCSFSENLQVTKGICIVVDICAVIHFENGHHGSSGPLLRRTMSP